MSKFVIRNINDIVLAIPRMVGFVPESSLVVASVGSPSFAARMDIPANLADIAEALAPAQPHLEVGFVVAYTDSHDVFLDLAAEVPALMPTFEIREMLRVHDGRVYTVADPEGVPVDMSTDVFDPSYALRREDYVKIDTEPATATEAALAALEAYVSGNGAKAWEYLDRAAKLEPGHTLAGMVNRMVSSCVPPAVLKEALAELQAKADN